YFFVFGLGLVAALSTCLAVSGGLLLAISAKYNEQNPNLTGLQKFKPHIYFNAGRIASYTLLGGLIGVLGSVLVFSSIINGVLTIFVSLIMISLGFQMLGIFPWMNKITPKMPKFLAHKAYDSAGKPNKTGSFLFGASTFFFPCGFTQALQLYVLSQGSFSVGAFTMLAFSLGTLPSLMSIGAISSFSKGNFQRYFIKFAAMLVIFLGVLSLNSGFLLTGSSVDFGLFGVNSDNSAATGADIAEGKQVIEMKVVGLDYFPDKFTLKKGVSVEWRIDGTKAQGCAGIISVPKLGITKKLDRSSVTIINFTPESAGNIRFTCGMGMAGPGTFIVK
ncbi:MAG TPA: sulfite exporter TauE/SafE family protein, partial [Candidatus Brocadiales bacterium]|nr:sulfite exporter TauE/SafE family protein [Candidatus Brocadiales bacterium]